MAILKAIQQGVKTAAKQKKEEIKENVKQSLYNIPLVGRIAKRMDKGENKDSDSSMEVKQDSANSSNEIEILQKSNIILTQIADNIYNIAGHLGAQLTSLNEVRDALEQQNKQELQNKQVEAAKLEEQSLEASQSAPVAKEAAEKIKSPEKKGGILDFLKGSLNVKNIVKSVFRNGLKFLSRAGGLILRGLTLFTNPIGIAAAIFGAIGFGIYKYFTDPEFKKTVDDLFTGVSNFVSEKFSQAGNLIKQYVIEPVVGFLQSIRDKFIDGLISLVENIPDLGFSKIEEIKSSLKQALSNFKTNQEKIPTSTSAPTPVSTSVSTPTPTNDQAPAGYDYDAAAADMQGTAPAAIPVTQEPKPTKVAVSQQQQPQTAKLLANLPGGGTATERIQPFLGAMEGGSVSSFIEAAKADAARYPQPTTSPAQEPQAVPEPISQPVQQQAAQTSPIQRINELEENIKSNNRRLSQREKGYQDRVDFINKKYKDDPEKQKELLDKEKRGIEDYRNMVKASNSQSEEQIKTLKQQEVARPSVTTSSPTPSATTSNGAVAEKAAPSPSTSGSLSSSGGSPVSSSPASTSLSSTPSAEPVGSSPNTGSFISQASTQLDNMSTMSKSPIINNVDNSSKSIASTEQGSRHKIPSPIANRGNLDKTSFSFT